MWPENILYIWKIQYPHCCLHLVTEYYVISYQRHVSDVRLYYAKMEFVVSYAFGSEREKEIEKAEGRWERERKKVTERRLSRKIFTALVDIAVFNLSSTSGLLGGGGPTKHTVHSGIHGNMPSTFSALENFTLSFATHSGSVEGLGNGSGECFWGLGRFMKFFKTRHLPLLWMSCVNVTFPVVGGDLQLTQFVQGQTLLLIWLVASGTPLGCSTPLYQRICHHVHKNSSPPCWLGESVQTWPQQMSLWTVAPRPKPSQSWFSAQLLVWLSLSIHSSPSALFASP